MAGGSDRQARFDREARLLASLNRPNIGSIWRSRQRRRACADLELIEGGRSPRLAPVGPIPEGWLPIADVITIAADY
jgi:hypothetical protein